MKVNGYENTGTSRIKIADGITVWVTYISLTFTFNLHV